MRYAMILSTVFLVACGSTDPEVGAEADSSNTASDASADDDACWWCVDGSDAQAPETIDPGKDPGKGEGKKEYILWKGVFDTTTSKGEFSFEVQLEDRVCHVTYAVDSLESVGDCENCEFAYSFTVGDQVDATSPDLCPEGLNQEGTTRSYGHGTTDTGYGMELLKLADDGWTAVGLSMVGKDEPTWEFFDLIDSPKSSGGKGEATLDEACYDACIKKGSDEATCKAACSDTEDGKGNGKDTGNDSEKACYDECIEKGGSVEECKTTCAEETEGKGGGESGQACYDACIEKGGSGEECKKACVGEGEGEGRDGK